jgi:hypothetical protein
MIGDGNLRYGVVEERENRVSGVARIRGDKRRRYSTCSRIASDLPT